jgi:hypothetical protein
MPLDASFVENIEYPNHTALQRALSEACTNTSERLVEMGFESPDEWLVRKAALAYFYDWEQDTPEFTFVLPDPGNLGKQFTSEIRALQSAGPNIPYRDQITIYRDIASKWYLNHQTDFPQEFFSLLHSHDLIEYNDGWRAYVRRGEFFDDFYMTDIIKYRVGGFNASGQRASQAFRRQVKQELAHIDPTIIFVFGGTAWNIIRSHLKLTPVDPTVGDETSIIDSHGELYYTDSDTSAFIVPLGHMSGQVWWRFPPEEYVDRLDSALTELCGIATDDLQPPTSLYESDVGSSRESSALDDIAEEVGEVSEFDKRK